MTDCDIVIRGGTIIDGSGGNPYVADVGICDGVVTVIGSVQGDAAEVIDATGKLVTPGFVDVHTHYDGQAIWSDRLDPSSRHGVTTVVMGNCGVGFAPCRQEDHELLVSVMEGVEDIPEVVMTEGLPWNWETFPQYLDALEARPRDIDVAAFLPHSPLRVYVMGERGANREAANAEDLAEMQRLIGEAIDAGALGFATSRVFFHRRRDGALIPSVESDWSELFAIGDAMARKGAGQLQIVTNVGEGVYDEEIAMLAEFAKKTGRPVTFTLAQTNSDRDAWRRALAAVESAKANGLSLIPQVFPRPVGMIMGLDTSVNPFTLCPTFRDELAGLPLTEKVVRMRDAAVREKLLNETPDEEGMPLFQMARSWDLTFPLQSPLDYEPSRERSIEALAAQAGVTSPEYMYDALLGDGGHAKFLMAVANYAEKSLDVVLEIMRHPDAILGLGDGGAHYGVICDASYPTFVLSHWTRDRNGEKLSIPEAVAALSRKPAEAIRLLDRGLVREGYKADINVIDYDRLQLGMPYMVSDLPGSGKRLMQGATGYVATIVSGEIILRNDKPSDALPGRLVRGAQATPGKPEPTGEQANRSA